MADKIELNNNDQYIIAEYIYSEQTDILIISDAIELVEMLARNELISESLKDEYKDAISRKDFNIVGVLNKKLTELIPDDVCAQIMQKYFKGQLQ